VTLLTHIKLPRQPPNNLEYVAEANMPPQRIRRRNKADTLTSSQLAAPFMTSPDGCSSSDADYPTTNRIMEQTNLLNAPFNLPGLSPDNSEESSDGWSDSEGLSSEDEEATSEHNNSSQHDLESSMMNSAGDGLLLVSDDEKEVNGDDDFSDSALNLSASKRLSMHSYDGNGSCSSPEPSSTIPTCVALGDLPFDDHDPDCSNFGDPSRNYDSRYDGSLQDLMQGTTDPGLGKDNDNDDSDDSSTEMAGYLSTAPNGGDMRDRFLKPYVGERPPTPPSPSQNVSPTRSPTRSSHTKRDLSPRLFQSPLTQSPPRVPLMDERPTDFTPYYKPVATYQPQSVPETRPEPKQEMQSSTSYTETRDDVHNARTVSYGDDQALCGPTLSGISNDEDRTLETLLSLNKARERDRRLIRMLIVGLGCTLVLLALLVGGVLALVFFRSSPQLSPSPTVSAPTTPAMMPTPPASAPVSGFQSSPPTVAPAPATRLNDATPAPVVASPLPSPSMVPSAVASTNAARPPSSAPEQCTSFFELGFYARSLPAAHT
jgi:hypothetical protein